MLKLKEEKELTMTETSYCIITSTNIYWYKNRYNLLIFNYYMIELKNITSKIIQKQ